MTSAQPIAALEQDTPSREIDSRPAETDSRPTYSCPGCGHVLRVSGLGRHRIYFELGDERSVDPVMNGACPGCGQGLPGKNPAGARS